jgi:pilus assembly protein CpaC
VPQRERTSLPQPTPAVPDASQPAPGERDDETPQTPDTLRETLEHEIKQTFPDSSVRLKHTGDTLVVSGSARNRDEATSILSIVRRNAPDRVVNLLRVPREQPMVLRIVVAEVNRTAARSLGLDFGIGDKQATIVSNRPSGDAGSPTLIGNGWIDQALQSLQDLHYAQILAAPALTTLNGQAARFQVGGEFPVPVVSRSPKGAVQGVHFHPYGVRLSARPVVIDSDRIRLTVETEVRGADPRAAAQVNGTAVPGLKVRTLQSTVELQEGETLVLADLVRAPTSDAEFQAMTRGPRPASTDNPSSGKELVVLVSPLLLHPESKEHAGGSAKPLNPQDIKGYPRSHDTLSSRAEALYLIGPRGYAGATRQEARRR